MRKRVTFGASEMIFEPPDTVVLLPRGMVDGVMADAMMERLVEWSRERPYVMVLVNLEPLVSFAPEARRVLVSNGHRLPPRALALYGASFGVRVALDLMERASTLLGSKGRWASHAPDEASARAWLAEMRKRLAPGG